MISDIKHKAESSMKNALASTGHDFSNIRTGRASTSIFEKVLVDYYGTRTALNQLASLTVPEPQQIVIQPFDKTAIPAIEKAIQSSDLGLSPMNDGVIIRVNFPQLNEERRRDLVKKAKALSEDHKVSVRNARRAGNDELKKAETDALMSKDEAARGRDELDKITDRYCKEIDELFARKEMEIMEV